MATQDILKGELMCNYGGELITDKESAGESKYHLEIKRPHAVFYTVHCVHIHETFVKFLNNSKKHPNFITKVILHPVSGRPNIIFKAQKTEKEKNFAMIVGQSTQGLMTTWVVAGNVVVDVSVTFENVQ